MKLLNIESLAVATGRQLKIGTTVHEIKPLKVVDFIRITEQANKIHKLAQSGELTTIEEVKLTVELIKSATPTVTEDELYQLSLPELEGIAQFIRGADLEEVTETIAENQEAEAQAEGK